MIKLRDITLRYGEKLVLDRFSLDLPLRGLTALSGPSGCGKTTLLRMIAGFNTVDGGEICFDEQVINNLPAHKRDIGMVFQNYAIFPHLNVADNVAYGLKARKVPKAEIDPRVNEALKMVQIDQLKARQPNELSGGQQQRVALARAFVIEPGVLLMDEPLSNLDAKLRVQMRTTIKKLQRRLGITTIYVTHDQEEALAISDRIAVMNQGNIMQIGRPEEIYRKPANPFVANFIGVSNFINCTVDGQDPKAAAVRLHDGYSFQMSLRAPYSGEVILSARPEQLFFSEQGLPGKVNMSTFLGDFIQYEVELSTGQVLELNEYTKDVDGAKNDGEEVHISFNPKQVSLYRKDTEEVLSC